MQTRRAENEIEPVSNHRVWQLETNPSPSSRPSALLYQRNAFQTPDGSYDSKTSWDKFLADVRTASREMHQTRKRRIQWREKTAGWCKWRARSQATLKGDFVEEFEVGYEIPRAIDEVTWSIKLGYRRNDAVMNDADLDLDERGLTEKAATGGESVASNADQNADDGARHKNGIEGVVEGSILWWLKHQAESVIAP
jgi:hypothetical protein